MGIGSMPGLTMLAGGPPFVWALTLLALLLVAPPAALAVTGGWQVQYTGTPEPLYDVSFVDLTQGWVVGSYGTILVTDNGGATWARQAPPAEAATFMLTDVSFVDPLHGWIVGSGWGRTAASSCDHRRWRIVAIAEVRPRRADRRQFCDTTRGLVTYRGGLLSTADGGATWTPRDTGIPQCSWKEIEFVDTEHAWLLGRSVETQVTTRYVIVASADGG